MHIVNNKFSVEICCSQEAVGYNGAAARLRQPAAAVTGAPVGIALHAWEDNPMVRKVREEAYLYIRYEVEAPLRQNLWG